MGIEAIGAQATIQARIDAQEALDAIIYGQRTLREMGGRAYGISTEWAAPGWALAQWDAAKAAAATFGLELGNASADWILKRAKKAAQDELAAAKDAAKAIGTTKQLRLALAA